MRDTKEMTQGAIDFKDKIDQLNADQREHLRKAIERLVECCVDQTRHAVIVFGKDDDPRAEVFTLNCNEMDAAFMLSCLSETFMSANLEDAPAKEMFN
jgi:hypothetical protein